MPKLPTCGFTLQIGVCPKMSVAHARSVSTRTVRSTRCCSSAAEASNWHRPYPQHPRRDSVIAVGRRNFQLIRRRLMTIQMQSIVFPTGIVDRVGVRFTPSAKIHHPSRFTCPYIAQDSKGVSRLPKAALDLNSCAAGSGLKNKLCVGRDRSAAPQRQLRHRAIA